jgi:aryl-alcohol dehydrogenase-like predicted oxidoreductase
MQTRPLGDTGIPVSEIGLGGWQLGEEGWSGPGEAESVRLVHEALAAGVTFVDTAPCYGAGRSEEILGRALEGRRGEVVLCTKFGRSPEGTDFDPGRITWSVEASLRRLRTDYLDVLLLHNPPASHLDGRASPHFPVLERLRERGLVRVYGASVDWAAEIDTVLQTSASRALEVWFSAFHQEPGEAMGRAREVGAGTIIKVPLESGWLTGKYDGSARFTDVRSRWSSEDIARRASLLNRFRDLLPAGVSISHAALRFVLSHPGVSTVIPGAKTAAQLRDNLAAADQLLAPSVVAEIRALHAEHLADRPFAW